MHLAILSTGLLIVVGATLVSSVFFLPTGEASTHPAMLSFTIRDETNMPQWCEDLSLTLSELDVKATVFVAGKLAEQHPDCVSSLSSNVKLDVGSTTFNHISLLSIDDYTAKLEEVENGKRAVDSAGDIDSLVFKAPYGDTDEDIFSLLNRSGILADFSYDDHYNKQHEGYYIWFNATSYHGVDHDASFYRRLPAAQYPLIINFDNDDSMAQIRELIQELKETKIAFVNASDLTRMELTIRRDTE